MKENSSTHTSLPKLVYFCDHISASDQSEQNQYPLNMLRKRLYVFKQYCSSGVLELRRCQFFATLFFVQIVSARTLIPTVFFVQLRREGSKYQLRTLQTIFLGVNQFLMKLLSEIQLNKNALFLQYHLEVFQFDLIPNNTLREVTLT